MHFFVLSDLVLLGVVYRYRWILYRFAPFLRLIRPVDEWHCIRFFNSFFSASGFARIFLTKFTLTSVQIYKQM